MYPNRYISQAAEVVILEHVSGFKDCNGKNPPQSNFELVFSTTPRFQIFKKLKRISCANRNDREPCLAAKAAANGA
jgi:hypothetical protein